MEYSYSYSSAPSPAVTILSLIFAIVSIVAMWKIYTKAGKPGWAAIVPIYNIWVLYEIVCNRGTAMFRLLIPFYNIYWAIKTDIKLAHAYGQSTGFGVGLIFLGPIFECILGFGSSRYVGPQNM